MDIEGRIIQVLDLQSGEGKGGPWKKQSYVLETMDTLPKKICFTVWGDKIDQFAIQKGDMIKAAVDIESREYNGRWYTDVKAWKVEKSGKENPQSPDLDFVQPETEDESELPF